MEKKIYFTVTGTKYRYGSKFFEPGMAVRLKKEPDNEADKEAIRVEMEGLGLVGYVANSPYTVQGESYSAGRLYDKIGDEAAGTVLYVLPEGVLCRLDEASLLPDAPFSQDEDAFCADDWFDDEDRIDENDPDEGDDPDNENDSENRACAEDTDIPQNADDPEDADVDGDEADGIAVNE